MYEKKTQKYVNTNHSGHKSQTLFSLLFYLFIKNYIL